MGIELMHIFEGGSGITNFILQDETLYQTAILMHKELYPDTTLYIGKNIPWGTRTFDPSMKALRDSSGYFDSHMSEFWRTMDYLRAIRDGKQHVS